MNSPMSDKLHGVIKIITGRPTIIFYIYTCRHVGTPNSKHTRSLNQIRGQQNNIGEKPTIILYTYTYRHLGTPKPEHTINRTLNRIKNSVLNIGFFS